MPYHISFFYRLVCRPQNKSSATQLETVPAFPFQRRIKYHFLWKLSVSLFFCVSITTVHTIPGQRPGTNTMKVKPVKDSRELIGRTPSTNSVDSQSSTVTAHVPLKEAQESKASKKTDKKKKSKKGLKRKDKRSVHFAEHKNEYYKDSLSTEERETMWYSIEENAHFRSFTVGLVQRITAIENRDAQKKGLAWSHSLNRAYAGFCEADSVEAVEKTIMQNSHTPMKASTVGLEKWAIRPMMMDRIKRRRELYDLILKLQEARYDSERQKLHELRTASRSLSRPARLIAHHVAQLSLRQSPN